MRSLEQQGGEIACAVFDQIFGYLDHLWSADFEQLFDKKGGCFGPAVSECPAPPHLATNAQLRKVGTSKFGQRYVLGMKRTEGVPLAEFMLRQVASLIMIWRTRGIGESKSAPLALAPKMVSSVELRYTKTSIIG